MPLAEFWTAVSFFQRIASIALLGLSGMCLISFVYRSEIFIDRVNGYDSDVSVCECMHVCMCDT